MAASIAIIGFGSIILILFVVLLYMYYKDKDNASPLFNFIFNTDAQQNKSTATEYAEITLFSIAKQNDKYIITIDVTVPDTLLDKKITIKHTNFKNNDTNEGSITSTMNTISVTVKPTNQDLAGINIIDVYVNDEYFGTKVYELSKTLALLSNNTSSAVDPASIVDTSSFSYKLEYASVPHVKIDPVGIYMNNVDFAKCRLIQSNSSGGIKIQSLDGTRYLDISYDSGGNMTAGFTGAVSYEDAATFYFHNVTDINNYNGAQSSLGKVKIGNKDTGDGCYFLVNDSYDATLKHLRMKRWIDMEVGTHHKLLFNIVNV